MKRDRFNQKGFSLIELIIAIAVLVVLTGLLAPQFMKYVEKARQAKMMQKLDSVYETLRVAYIEATESGKVNTKGGIVIIRGSAPSGDELDEKVLEVLKESIEESEINKLSIMTQTVGEATGNANSLSDVLIYYYPTTEYYPYYYYRLNYPLFEPAYPGTYGECVSQGNCIVWKE